MPYRDGAPGAAGTRGPRRPAGGQRRLHHPWEHNFIRDIKACGRVAAARDMDMAFLTKATPYSLRRGRISLRGLAREVSKRIVDDFGTSTAMIHRHYLHELDMRDEQPESFGFDGAVEAARRAARHLRAGCVVGASSASVTGATAPDRGRREPMTARSRKPLCGCAVPRVRIPPPPPR